MCLQVNALDTLGQTALHRAALAGHLQTCRQLLGYGADASLVSLQGFTAAQMGNEAVQQILNGTLTSACGWLGAEVLCFSCYALAGNGGINWDCFWANIDIFWLRLKVRRCKQFSRPSESTHLFRDRDSTVHSYSIHTQTDCVFSFSVSHLNTWSEHSSSSKHLQGWFLCCCALK